MDRNILFPRSIRYLLAVAEYRSFTRAAEALYVSQPTLSQQIKQLEDMLDIQLLDRTGRTVRLTAAGEIYLQHARRALVELDTAKRAVHELNDLTRGSIRLGMTPITDFLLAPMLEGFNARYPGIAMNALEMPQDAIEDALAEDRVDIGIAFSSTLSPRARSEEIDTHILFVESLCLVVGEKHPLYGHEGPLGKEVIEQVPLVLFNTHYALRRHMAQYFLQEGISPTVAIDAASLSVIIEIVRQGRLGTILPNTIAHTRNEFHSINLIPELPAHAVSLICLKNAYKSPACQAFGGMIFDWASTKYHADVAPPCAISVASADAPDS
ncbi:MAG: transcriptional regulator CynR [Betaproteobacteria bacterium]|nr:transcriptional regulator CynR [Betaproteobacteria bacterium]